MVRDVLGEALEKVTMENEADLQQLVGAEVAMVKLSAQVLPWAAHLPGEPSDAPLLPGKFSFDEVSDVWRFVHKKGVNPFSCRLYYP